MIDDSLRSEFLVARAKRLLGDSPVVEEGFNVIMQILGEQRLSATNGVGDVGLMIEFDPDFKDGIGLAYFKGFVQPIVDGELESMETYMTAYYGELPKGMTEETIELWFSMDGPVNGWKNIVSANSNYRAVRRLDSLDVEVDI